MIEVGLYLLIGFILGLLNTYFGIWTEGPANYKASYEMPFAVLLVLWPFTIIFFSTLFIYRKSINFVFYLKNKNSDDDILL